jgi:hypothetical protein
VVLLVVIGVPVVYLGFQFATATQKKFNEARANDDDPGLIGGQVSHILEVNQVLEATDPANMGHFPDAGADGGGAIGRARKARSAMVGASGTAMTEDPGGLPVQRSAWSLDAATAEIPAGRIAGTISKLDFVAEDAWLVTGSSRPVLMFSQGDSIADPDLALLVYLRLNPGESVENRTWLIAPEQKSDVPQVIKRWKAGAPARSQQRTFTGGYAMKLELGKIADRVMPGKIYVALPDPEQSVVSGHFQALIRVPATSQGRAPSAGQGAGSGNE